MQVSGTVTDAENRPIANVRVDLAVDGIRSAVVYSDDEGRYSHTDSASYAAGTLSLAAAKSGYGTRELTRPVTAQAMTVDITMESSTAGVPWRMIAIIGGAALAVVAVVVVLLIVLRGNEGPAVVTPVTEGEVVAAVREDCLPFTTRNVELRADGRNWVLTDGRSRMITFDDRRVGERALETIRHYRLDSRCFVGRPGPSMSYWLVGGQAPEGPMRGESCVTFNARNLRVRETAGRWLLVAGTNELREFPNENEARLALEIMVKYRPSRLCSVGSPESSFMYIRR